MDVEIVTVARFLLTGIALLLAFLASVAWNRRKDAPSAGAFSVLVLAMAVYAFGYAGEIAQTTVAGAQLWLDVEYLALPWVPGLWLLTAFRHNGIRVRVPLLFLVPLVTFAGHYTNFANAFYAAPMTLVHRQPFWVLVVQRGPLSLLNNAYLFVAFLVSTGIFLSALRQASSFFRKQALILLIGSLIPFVSYFLYLIDLSPWGLDISPVTLGCTCLLLFYGFFRVGIFDLAPLARNLIFNTIRDGVLILDTRNRLLDFNPAATALLPELDKSQIGETIEDVLDGRVDLDEALARVGDPQEIQMGSEADPQYYEIRTWPLFSATPNALSDVPTKQIGRAVIFANVTAQAKLREDLRSRAETDPLTGVANRRRFYQALEMECHRFGRGRAPLSVLMIDLDHFKNVNDQYGHPVGDAVLRGAAHRLRDSLRKTDVLARYGGEEFSILLPETPYEGATIMGERIRLAMSGMPFEVEDMLIAITVSIGVASHATDREVDPQILLKKADLALYRAKATGRNRVEVL